MVRRLGLVFGTMAGLLPWLLALGMALIIVIVFAQRFGIFGQKIELPGGSVLVPTGSEGRSVKAFTFTARDGIRSIDSMPNPQAWLPRNSYWAGPRGRGPAKR